jgi:DNA invertase Pin-like site-specific DNA recombinase
MQPAPHAPAVRTNTVRIGYARVSGRTQDHQMQLDALAAADCREVIVETASTRGARPKLTVTLRTLKPGDTLVIYKPDRVARSMKELLVLLEDELHAREVNLEILTGICAGLHQPNGQTIADKMLFMVAAMAARWNASSSTNAPWTAWPLRPPRGGTAGGPPPSTTTPSPSPAPAGPAASRSPRSPLT